MEVTRLAAAIDRLAPEGSQYREAAAAITTRESFDHFKVPRLAGVLSALRADVEDGFTSTFEELVHAEVFDDFLSMTEELHRKDYQSAAAVLAGSVLEGHLHKLAAKHGVAQSKSVDRLGQDLVKASVVTEPERKQLESWYGQRTEGAHGRPENVIREEVGRMIPGIRDFMVRHRA